MSKHEDSKARIIAAAMPLFEKDLAGTTIRHVAAEADTTKSNVLHHFGSKDGLLAACLRATWSRVLDEATTRMVLDMLETDDPVEMAYAIALKAFRLARHHPELVRVTQLVLVRRDIYPLAHAETQLNDLRDRLSAVIGALGQTSIENAQAIGWYALFVFARMALAHEKTLVAIYGGPPEDVMSRVEKSVALLIVTSLWPAPETKELSSDIAETDA